MDIQIIESNWRMEEEAGSFSCRIESAKVIADVLQCMVSSLKKDHPCFIEANQDALMFVVTGQSKSTQARATLDCELFEEYACTDETVRLVLNLTTLLDCLQIFGTSSETTTATMTYSASDAIFRLTLEEMGVVTTCDISAMYHEDEEIESGLFGAFRDSTTQSQIIVKSKFLLNAVQGATSPVCNLEILEVIGNSVVIFEVIKNPGNMKLYTKGTMDSCEIDFPRTSEAFTSFQCEKSVSWTYATSMFQVGMKALGVATETCIRISEEGIMHVQHRIEMKAHGKETFIDFLMVCEESYNYCCDGDGDEERDE